MAFILVRRSWLTAFAALCAVETLAAPPNGPWTIPATEQRQRDDARQRILTEELRAEQAALAQTTNRAAERRRAGDAPGAADAEEARTRHLENIAALERELAGPGRAMATKPGARPLGAAPARRDPEAPRPWDLYARPVRPAPAAGAAPAAAWDLYRPRVPPATPRAVPEPPAQPFVAYRDMPPDASPARVSAAPAWMATPRIGSRSAVEATR